MEMRAGHTSDSPRMSPLSGPKGRGPASRSSALRTYRRASPQGRIHLRFWFTAASGGQMPVFEIWLAGHRRRRVGVVAKSFKIIGQAEVMVIERLGRFHRVARSGLNILIPFVERPRCSTFVTSRRTSAA